MSIFRATLALTLGLTVQACSDAGPSTDFEDELTNGRSDEADHRDFDDNDIQTDEEEDDVRSSQSSSARASGQNEDEDEEEHADAEDDADDDADQRGTDSDDDDDDEERAEEDANPPDDDSDQGARKDDGDDDRRDDGDGDGSDPPGRRPGGTASSGQGGDSEPAGGMSSGSFGDFVTGLPTGTPLSGLTQDEVWTLCFSFTATLTDQLLSSASDVACTLVGIGVGSGAFGQQGFDEQACAQGVSDCLRDAGGNPVDQDMIQDLLAMDSSGACDEMVARASLAECDATVGDFEACVNAGLEQTQSALLSFDCQAFASASATNPPRPPQLDDDFLLECAALCPMDRGRPTPRPTP